MSKEQQLNPEVISYVENLNKQYEAEKIKRMELQNSLGNISNFSGATDGREPNLVKFQLDPKEILEDAYHFLSAHEVKVKEDQDGVKEYWAEPEDDRLKIFSVYGVKLIMNLLSMYINKNTLLSCYDEQTIRWKVRDFGIELYDLFLNKYESLLYVPSPEELFDKYKPIVKSNNLKITDDELYNKCLVWSEDELTDKENNVTIMCGAIIDMVHSTYMRALKGGERKSLGERGININQNNNEPVSPLLSQNKQGGFFSFMRG